MPEHRRKIARAKLLGILLAVLAWPGSVEAQEEPTGVEVAWENADVPAAACAFGPDGQRLACSTRRGGIAVIDAETGERLRVFGSGDFDQFTPPDVLAWGPGGRRLAVASSRLTGAATDRAVAVYAAETGERLDMIDFGTAPHGVAFGPDGDRLAVASMYDDPPGPVVRLYDLESGEALHEAPLHPGSYDERWDRIITFSPGGDSLALGGAGFWSWAPPTEPEVRFNAGGLNEAVTSVQWSPGGVAIAFVAGPDEVLLRKAGSEEATSSKLEWSEEASGSGPSFGEQPVVAFDGNDRLIAVSPAGILKVWSVEADPEMYVPTGSEIFSHRVPEATDVALHGDRFVLVSDRQGQGPLRMFELVYGEDGGAGDEATQLGPERLATLLPAEIPGGFQRGKVETGHYQGDPDAPMAHGRYERGDETFLFQVQRLDAEGEEQARSLLDRQAESPDQERWKETYRGYTLYDSVDHAGETSEVTGGSLTLLVPGFYVGVNGLAPHSALHAALDALDLEALTALVPDGGSEK